MTNIPVVPIAAGALARAFITLATPVIALAQSFRARAPQPARRRVLAGLDSRMLARYRVSRAPICATHFPSRSGKTRPRSCTSGRSGAYRYRNLTVFTPRLREAPVADRFTRPATDRPARRAI